MGARALLAVLFVASLAAAAVALSRSATQLGEESAAADGTPPRVHALRSSGKPGTKVRLLYRVTDEGGRSSEKVAVRSGSRILSESGWADFGPAEGKVYYFEFPAPQAMSGTNTFCVQSRDPSGNVSKPSCASLIRR
jgi:hypothetical protein